MKSRRGFAIQRLMNALRQAHADRWFILFDTLTLSDDRLEAFYDNPNALRDYFRDIGRMVLAVFFFSSRRRHTRLQGDWSSDVCSSDLLRLHHHRLKCSVNSFTPSLFMLPPLSRSAL